jgi:TM2 domain-containing membrane protein YozV
LDWKSLSGSALGLFGVTSIGADKLYERQGAGNGIVKAFIGGPQFHATRLS